MDKGDEDCDRISNEVVGGWNKMQSQRAEKVLYKSVYANTLIIRALKSFVNKAFLKSPSNCTMQSLTIVI